jgi:hypothetical protein
MTHGPADSTIVINTFPEGESLHNYNSAFWALLPLLLLWWLPIILYSLVNLFTPRRPRERAVETAAVTGSATAGAAVATAGGTAYRILDRLRSWSRPARDAFLTLGIGLLLAAFVFGGITRGVWIATWIAFAAAVLLSLLSLSLVPNILFRFLSLLSILAFAGAALYILIKSLVHLPHSYLVDDPTY